MTEWRICSRWIACVLLVPAAAGAHHSRTQYDGSDVQEIQGELISVSWANPHAAFSVRVTSASGDDRHVAARVMGFAVRALAHGRDAGPVRRRHRGAPCRTRLDSGAQSIFADEHAATGRHGSRADDRRRRVLGRPAGRRQLRSGERGDLDAPPQRTAGFSASGARRAWARPATTASC